MFNIESEYDKYRKEAEFVEIEGYNDNGEKIDDEKTGVNRTVLSLFLFGAIGVMGYFGYGYMQNSHVDSQEKAVMGVFIENDKNGNPLKREEIEKGLNSLYQDESKQQKIDETITSIVDDFVASKTHSYTSKKDISNELNGMVDSFYTQEAIPARLDSMVDDFYSKQSPNQNRRFVTVKEGDTLAKISKKFYGNHMKYQKIIEANHRLKESSTLYIGQKINIPY